MAKKTWIGGATAVAQVSSATVTGYDGATTYTITVTGEDGSTTTIDVAGTTDADGTAAALRAAWNASIHRLVTPITAAGSGAIVQLTADEAGIPFRVASSVASGTGTFGAFSTGTVSQGPNDYGCAANWYEGSIPAGSDDVLIQGTQSILYSLNQSAVEVDDFIVDATYSGQIGTAQAYLQIDVGNSDLFQFSGSGTAYIDLGGAACSPKIRRTKTATNGQAGLYLKGSALATVEISGGNMRLINGSSVTTLIVAEGATCVVESGVTLTTAHNSGTLTSYSAATTINCSSGIAELDGAVTTLNVDGGTVNHKTGTVTTLNADGGVVDLTKSLVARTVATLNARGGEVRYDPNVITLTNAIAGPGPLSLRRVG